MQEITIRKRNGNIELLRVISMLMVVMLHTLGKGNLLTPLHEEASAYTYAAWVLEALAVGCIDVYVFVTGYFLTESKFKFGRFFELILEVMFYSVVITLIMGATGYVNLSGFGIHDWLEVVLPIHMNDYWFMTVYVLLYIMTPVLSRGVKSITQSQHMVVIVLMLIYECIVKSVLPFTTEIEDEGYGIGWFITLFLIAAYIRLYGFKFLTTPLKGFLLYIAGAILTFTEYAIVEKIYAATGRLAYLSKGIYSYNHIFVLLSALGLFACFLAMKERDGFFYEFICLISPMTLGVYLAHEHLLVRYEWPEWLRVTELRNLPLPLYILGIIITMLIVYCAGTVIDYIRVLIFRLCKLFNNKVGLTDRLKKWDSVVNGTETR